MTDSSVLTDVFLQWPHWPGTVDRLKGPAPRVQGSFDLLLILMMLLTGMLDMVVGTASSRQRKSLATHVPTRPSIPYMAYRDCLYKFEVDKARYSKIAKRSCTCKALIIAGGGGGGL